MITITRNGSGPGGGLSYAWLFLGVSLILLAGPALGQLLPAAASSTISALSFSAAMLSGIWSFTHSRRVFRFAATVALGGTAAAVIFYATGMEMMRLLTLNLLVIFLLFAIWHAGRDVLFSGRVDLNHVIGGLCIYQMLGLVWATMYAGIHGVNPESFVGAGLGDSPRFWDYVYYSFVTLTTLGYGDITPQTPFARALVYMEALVGQLYLAVLIAALVGAHLAQRTRN